MYRGSSARITATLVGGDGRVPVIGCDTIADRRNKEEGGIGTKDEREYVRTFFDRSQLKVRHGETMRAVCERLHVKPQVLGLEEGASVDRGTPKL